MGLKLTQDYIRSISLFGDLHWQAEFSFPKGHPRQKTPPALWFLVDAVVGAAGHDTYKNIKYVLDRKNVLKLKFSKQLNRLH